LGVVLAQAGLRVTLIDADLRRPRLHEILDIPNRRGLSDIFVQKEIALDGIVSQTSTKGLEAISSGSLPPNPAELVSSEKMVAILDKINDKTDFLVIDTPPIMAATDAAALASRVDGVLLVVKPGSTKFGACQQTVEQLRRSGANVLGVVLNDVALRGGRYNYYYRNYHYEYYNHDGAEEQKRRFFPRRKKRPSPTTFPTNQSSSTPSEELEAS
jgi:capsular exopolysaccharide synthesis family protein